MRTYNAIVDRPGKSASVILKTAVQLHVAGREIEVVRFLARVISFGGATAGGSYIGRTGSFGLGTARFPRIAFCFSTRNVDLTLDDGIDGRQ